MASILVAYGSGEGQTATVARRVESVLDERGHDVTVVDLTAEAAEPTVEAFDAVLVGSPVNNRKHLPAVVAFVDANAAALAERPTAFVQLSFASVVSAQWGTEGAAEFVDDLVERTGWHPDRVGRFAGAVKYTQYDRLTRWFFRLVSAVTTGDTDTSRDYEYTDWDAVEAFAADFATFVERGGSSRAADADDRGRGKAVSAPGTARPERTRSAARMALALGVLALAYWLVVRRR